MAVTRDGGAGSGDTNFTVPTFIQRNLNADSVNQVQNGLDNLWDWVHEVGRDERAPRIDEARRLIDSVWDKADDSPGYLLGQRVSLDDFFQQLDAIDPALADGGGGGDASGPVSGARITPTLIRDLQEQYPNLRSVGLGDNDEVIVQVEGSLSPADMRAIGNRVGGTVAVEVVDPSARPATDGDVQPAPPPTSGTSGGGSGGAGGTGGGVPTVTSDPTLPEAGAPRQIPGGAELWRVDGRDVYLAYKIPGTNVPLTWKVENPDRLKAIFGDDVPNYDRELTKAQYDAQSPWYAGMSAEIQNTDEHPWQQFMSDFEQAAELRPWLHDPTVQAVMATAYLEGRAPTADEFSTTDWWQSRSADERRWLEESATLGRKEVRRRQDDATLAVQDALREAGMDNAPKRVAEYMAQQRLTGKWSEEYFTQQVRKLADPWAPGKLDKGVLAAIRDPELGAAADARAVEAGQSAVEDRVREIFGNRQVDPSRHLDGSEVNGDERVSRIAREILSGKRTFSDVRDSVDMIAAKVTGGRPGGLDVTAENEDRVRQLATQWLGPVVGQLDPKQISKWAGQIRNNPDAEQEFVDFLRQRRMALLPNYENENLTYEDIVQPVRNLATNIWGQPVQDEMMLVDLANMGDYTQMSQRLRKEGLTRNVDKVRQDMLTGLMGTDLGGQVVRSQV